MAEAALKIEEVHETVLSRRFELADLSEHGPWLLKRFAQKRPDLSEQHVAGWLRGRVYDNEHLFLYQPHAVALFQLVHSPGIKMVKIVQEHLVWVENREDKGVLEAAADFYPQIKQWAKQLEAERMICCEDTDVPKSLIEARIGRLFDTKISHARV